jgi:hypothetical protein
LSLWSALAIDASIVFDDMYTVVYFISEELESMNSSLNNRKNRDQGVMTSLAGKRRTSSSRVLIVTLDYYENIHIRDACSNIPYSYDVSCVVMQF